MEEHMSTKLTRRATLTEEGAPGQTPPTSPPDSPVGDRLVAALSDITDAIVAWGREPEGWRSYADARAEVVRTVVDLGTSWPAARLIAGMDAFATAAGVTVPARAISRRREVAVVRFGRVVLQGPSVVMVASSGIDGLPRETNLYVEPELKPAVAAADEVALAISPKGWLVGLAGRLEAVGASVVLPITAVAWRFERAARPTWAPIMAAQEAAAATWLARTVSPEVLAG
jgi:hypothetical protein